MSPKDFDELHLASGELYIDLSSFFSFFPFLLSLFYYGPIYILQLDLGFPYGK